MRQAGGKIPRLTGTNLDWVFKREQFFRGRGRKNVGRSWNSGVAPPWLSCDAAILGASLLAWECWLSERIAGFPPVGVRCPLVFTQNSVSGQGCLWQSCFAHHLALGDAVCPPRQAPRPTHLHPHPYFPIGGSISLLQLLDMPGLPCQQKQGAGSWLQTPQELLKL